MRNFKIGVMTDSFRTTFVDALDKAKELGAQGVQRTLCAGHTAIAADDRADVRAAFTVAVTGLRQLAAAYPGHVAEDTGRVPAQETEHHGSAAAGRCPGAVPGSGQQRKKET